MTEPRGQLPARAAAPFAITIFAGGIALALVYASAFEWGILAELAVGDSWEPLAPTLLVVLTALLALVRTQRVVSRNGESGVEGPARHEKRLQLILDSTADGIITIDESGTIESFNRAAELSFGWTAGEVVGRNVSILAPEPHRSRHDEYIAAYLRTGTARILGRLRETSGRRKDGSTFPLELAVSELEHEGERRFTAVLRDVTQRRQALEEIHKLAFYDNVTGLPNRRFLREQLERASGGAQRHSRSFAVLFIDIDRFTLVSHTIGSRSSDRLLAIVAERLMQSLRFVDYVVRADQVSQEDNDAGGMLARFGGDQFTVILSQISQPMDAARVAGRVRKVLAEPIPLDGRELFLTVSIGIAVYPNDGAGADMLMRSADVAMRYARDAGGNGFRFYSERMNADQSRRLSLECRLRGALERRDLSLLYQPIFDAVSRRVVGAEALLRWNDSEFGAVAPREFISILEGSGLIVPVGEWVLEAAATACRAWRSAGHGPIRMSVNVSVVQIRRSNIRVAVTNALTKARLTPNSLEIELTESTLMEVDEAQSRALRELKAMGIGIALDDFGTGYSSLSLLRNVPIDRVKIDRSFVDELTINGDDRALVSAIVAMAHSLRLKVVAEGVERKLQEEFLCSQGCDELQGFLLGRPVPADEFEQYLDPDAPDREGGPADCLRWPAEAPPEQTPERGSREE